MPHTRGDDDRSRKGGDRLLIIVALDHPLGQSIHEMLSVIVAMVETAFLGRRAVNGADLLALGDVIGLVAVKRLNRPVEDRIREGKDTGMAKLPFAAFAHNEAWLELSLIAQTLLCWTKGLLLEGELARAEPKRLRQRLLHAAGRLVRSARRLRLLLQADWPWAEALVTAFRRLRSLPAPSPP